MNFRGGTCDVQVSDKVISCVRKQGENTVRFLSAVKPSRHSTVSTCSSAIWPTLCSNLISENIHINGTPGLLPHIKNLRITRLTQMCAGQTWFLGPCPPCEISWECMYCIHMTDTQQREKRRVGGEMRIENCQSIFHLSLKSRQICLIKTGPNTLKGGA